MLVHEPRKVKMLFITSLSHPQIILEAMYLNKLFDLDLIVIKRKEFKINNIKAFYVLDYVKYLIKSRPITFFKNLVRNVPYMLKSLILSRILFLPMMDFLLYLFEYSVIIDRLKHKKYDVIYAHWAYPAGIVGLWIKYALSSKTKLLVSLWGYDIQSSRSYKYGVRRFYKIVLRNVLTQADAVIVNHMIHKIIVERFLKQRKYLEKVIYLPPGIPDLTRLLKDHDILMKKNIKEKIKNKILVLYAPSLRPIYGVMEFIKSIPLVTKKVPNVLFIIVGTGDLLDNAKQLVHELGIEDKVLFLGSVDYRTMLYLYRISRIVCDLCYMGHGTTSLEAICMGRLVIAIKSSKQIITHGSEGFLVNKGDYSSLAKYITTLLTDQELWLKMSRNARNKFEKCYNIKYRADKLVKLINQLVNGVSKEAK